MIQKRKSKGKFVSAVLGLVVLVGGLGAGIVLVQQSQTITPLAYDPPTCSAGMRKCTPDGKSLEICISGSWTTTACGNTGCDSSKKLCRQSSGVLCDKEDNGLILESISCPYKKSDGTVVDGIKYKKCGTFNIAIWTNCEPKLGIGGGGLSSNPQVANCPDGGANTCDFDSFFAQDPSRLGVYSYCHDGGVNGAMKVYTCFKVKGTAIDTNGNICPDYYVRQLVDDCGAKKLTCSSVNQRSACIDRNNLCAPGSARCRADGVAEYCANGLWATKANCPLLGKTCSNPYGGTEAELCK